jgi:hypothetical protein
VKRIQVGATDARGFAADFPAAELVAHDGIAAAAEAHERAAAAAQLARRDLTTLEQERPAAVEADRRAYADALEAGKRDPGTKHTDAADRKIRDAQRHVAALELVEQRAHGALAEAVEAGQEAWHTAVTAERDATREQAAAMLDELTAKLGKLAQLDALARFADGTARSYNPATVAPAMLRGSERVDIGTALAIVKRATLPPAAPRAPAFTYRGHMQAVEIAS